MASGGHSKPRTIRRILLLVLLAALVPTMLIQAWLHVQRFHTEQTRELGLHTDVSRAVAVAFRANIEDLAQGAHILGQTVLRFTRTEQDTTNQFLSAALPNYPSVIEFAWLDPEGRVVASSDRSSIGADRHSEEYLAGLGPERPWVLGNLQPDRQTGAATFVIAHRIEDDMSGLHGILTATIDAEQFADTRLKIHRSADAGFILFDHRGCAAFRRPFFPFREWEKRDFSKEEFVSAALAGREASGRLDLPVTGKSWFTARTPVPELGWVAGAGREYTAVMAPLWRDLSIGVGLSVLCLLLSGGLVFQYGRTILSELDRLQESVMAWGLKERTRAQELDGSIVELRKIAAAFKSVATQREKTEQALENQRARLQAILDNMPAGIIMVEGQPLRPVLINRLGDRILGRSVPPKIEKAELASYFQARRAATDAPYPIEQMPIVRAMSGESCSVDDIEIQRLDGSRAQLEVYGAPVYDSAGHITAAVAIFQDITERKKTEGALRESEERLRLFIEHAPASLAMFDSQMRYLSVSRRWLNDYNLGECDLIGRSHYEVFPEIPEYWKRVHQRALAGEVVQADTDRFERADGTILWLRWEVRPWHDAVGEIAGIVIFTEDITEQKRAEEAIRTAHDELELRVKERTAELKTYMAKLEESNQALQEFASIASHDMQEPLRKVITFGNVLKQKHGDSLGEGGKDYLDRMLKATSRMQSLLKRLLEYSRVSTTTEPFREFELAAVIREVLSDLEVTIEKTGGEVQVGDLPTIEADPTQMRQLFQNLIANGIKFHKEGEKPVIKVRSSPTDRDELQFVIEDNGIGFDEQYLDRIFAPFQRLHGASSQYEGTGMGLAICKKIVERHGGSIAARSAPGKGATFIVTLPRNSSPSEA